MSRAHALLMDICSRVRQDVWEPLDWSHGPPGILEPLHRAIQRMRDNFPADAGRLSAVGVSIPGRWDREKGLSLTYPRVRGWQDVPIQRMVQEWTDVPTSLIGYAASLALAEQAGRPPHALSLLCIEVEENIAMGIIVHGKVLEGATGSAGELGHITVDPAGPLCYCGNRGCLELVATCQAVAEEARRSRLLEEPPTATYGRVVERARSGDLFLRRLLGRVGTTLGIGVGTAINLFNPETIVFRGTFFDAGALVMTPLREAIRDRSFPTVLERLQIERSQLDDRAPAIGAGLLAIDQVLQWIQGGSL
jgi:predicted NBD/HSP70 family sugar kinase